MKNKQNKLRNTLSKKVNLQSDSKDLNKIEKEVSKLHSGRKNDNTILTTIHLSRETHTKIKIHCAANGLSIKEFITDKIEGYFK